MARKRMILIAFMLTLIYLLSPLTYIIPLNVYSFKIHLLFLSKSPLLWSKIYSILGSVNACAREPLSSLLLYTPEEYWGEAAEILNIAPPRYYVDTVTVLMLINASEWKYVKEAIILYKKGIVPFKPSSQPLIEEYVKPLPISGEEPILDWRYMVYIFTYRLICNMSNALDTAKYLCLYVHNYMTYDIAYWHRRSPKVLIELRRGTCTNFSILYVAMCRSIGIPARLVRDNSISRMTHAWSEVYIEGCGWIHVDPTVGCFNCSSYYMEKWGFPFHIVKAYNPIRGWIDVTPSYVPDYGTVIGEVLVGDKPTYGVNVEVYYPGNEDRPLLELKTNATGLFSFTAAEGRYLLKIYCQSIFKIIEIEVKAGGTVRIKVNLG